MALKQRAMWRQVMKREFTPESIDKVRKTGDTELFEENPLQRSVLDSCEPFRELTRPDRSLAYLEMAKNMPGASADTLRKLRKRLGLE